MKIALRKWRSVLLSAVLILLLFAAGCNSTPDYSAFTNADELLPVLELTEADLLPSSDSKLTFRADDPGKSSTYHLTFPAADFSEDSVVEIVGIVVEIDAVECLVDAVDFVGFHVWACHGVNAENE